MRTNKNLNRRPIMKTLKTIIIVIAAILIQSSAYAAQADGIQYYAVIMDGAKVGYATHSRIVTNSQVKTTDFVDMTLNRMGVSMNLKTSESCVETAEGKPVAFAAEQSLGFIASKTQGTIGSDGIVRVQTNSGGQQSPSPQNTFAWPKDAIMAEGLRLLIIEKRLKEGASYDVNIFSPSLLKAVSSHVKVGAKENVDLFGRIVPLTKVETVISMPDTGEITTVNYVDDQYEPLKTVMPMMDIKIELVACEKEVALGGNEIFDIGDKMFLASPQPIEDIGSAKQIGYSLMPTGDANNLIIPQSDNQRVQKLENGDVIVVVEPVSMPKGGKFPYRGNDTQLIEATKPSRYLQSDDPKIKELARQAIGNTKDAGEVARRIERFVADYVTDTSLSIGYASAAEVAQSRKGDCSEFSVLCAALCRAAGIPAKVVAGVAYTDDFMGRSGFGGHAWIEANIGGKWVGLDPTFTKGGRGFDAGHIALASGDGEPAAFFNIATTMGRFKIEKVMVERGK
jgi:hypothetical protein